MASKRAKKFYKSKTLIGLTLALFFAIGLPKLGMEIPAEYSTDVWAALVAFIVLGLRDAQGGVQFWSPKKEKETK